MAKKTKGAGKTAPLTSKQKSATRWAEIDAAALRDGVLKNGQPATGTEAITLWKRGEYILVKGEKE